MNRTNKLIIRVACILFVLLVIIGLSIKLVRKNQQCEEQTKKIEEQEMTIEHLQDEEIQEFLKYAKAVMSAEIIIEDQDHPFSRYSYDEQTFPAMETVELELTVRSIHLEKNQGTMQIYYEMKYLDQEGKTVMFSSATSFPSIWEIEKQDGKWVAVSVEEHP